MKTNFQSLLLKADGRKIFRPLHRFYAFLDSLGVIISEASGMTSPNAKKI
jgi:hypothetical protein